MTTNDSESARVGAGADAELPVLLDDISWCWWTRPRATRVGDLVYIGALDSKGRIVAASFDLRDRTSRRCVLAQLEDDDHNNPALVAEPGRPLVAFYSRHGCDDAVRFRLSARGGDLTEWDDERVLRFGGTTTYAQVHARGDELHLFTRVGETRWGYRRSLDWARTWGPARDFLAFDTDQQIYMPTVQLPDRRTVRVAVSGHPKEYEQKPLHDVWVCQVDLATGVVTRPGDGVQIANLLEGTGLPLGYDDLELAHRTPPERTVNLFDVGDGPVFEVGFVSKVKDDNATTDARYHVAAPAGDGRGGWRTEDVASAGTKFGYIHAGCYVGGMAFPHRSPGGQVFATREHAGLWYLERLDRSDDGAWTARQLLAPSRTRLTRPWAVTDPPPGLEVVALALEHYPDDDYFGSLSHLVGASLS